MKHSKTMEDVLYALLQRNAELEQRVRYLEDRIRITECMGCECSEHRCMYEYEG